MFVNTDADNLSEDKTARFPVHLARLMSVDASSKTVSIQWWSRGHAVNMQQGFEPSKPHYRFIECYVGKKSDDVPWTQSKWPADLVLPVKVSMSREQKKAVWVSPDSMQAMKAYCESFGPDRKIQRANRAAAHKRKR